VPFKNATVAKSEPVIASYVSGLASGCLKLTRRELSPVFSGIPPVHLRREYFTFNLALCAQLNINHPLHTLVQSAQFLGTQLMHS